MIASCEGSGSDPKRGFDVLSLMRALEKALVEKQKRPSDEAQQLFYEAMEAGSKKKEEELLTKVLELDSGNLDAWLVILSRVPIVLEDKIEVLQKLVTLGEKRLGPQAFKNLKGGFWGVIETRPYMRARAQLAENLREAGHIEEAITEWEAMLELNPNDNQGVRYSLLTCYLAEKRLDGARKLFEKYDNECQFNTVFAWGLVLERLLQADVKGAEKALAQARKQNPHTEAYLQGHRQLPKNLPDSYSPGAESEALCFADDLKMAWDRHAEARQWLAGHVKSVSRKNRKK